MDFRGAASDGRRSALNFAVSEGGQRVACTSAAAAARFRAGISCFVDTVGLNPPTLVRHNVTGPLTGQAFTVPPVSAGHSPFKEGVVQLQHNQRLFFADYEGVVDSPAFPSKCPA